LCGFCSPSRGKSSPFHHSPPARTETTPASMIPRTDLEGKNSLTFSLAFQARRQSCPYFIAKNSTIFRIEEKHKIMQYKVSENYKKKTCGD